MTTHTAVIDLLWGDNGKGSIVDCLAKNFNYVFRDNGANNAGHTVFINGERFATHLVPIGMLRGVPSVIGHGVSIDLDDLIEEMEDLKKKGIKLDGLRISEKCSLIVGSWHKLEDRLYEAVRAKHNIDKVGTTGRGVGPSFADQDNRVSLRLLDLYKPETLRKKLEMLIGLKSRILTSLCEYVGLEEPEKISLGGLHQKMLAQAEYLRPYVTDTTALMFNALRSDRKILFEKANGALLHPYLGTYPFNTASLTGVDGIYAGTGFPPNLPLRRIGVTKAYTTRVGNGPMPTEQDNETGEILRGSKEGNGEYGATTGRPRRCGWLDLYAVLYSVRLHGIDEIALTRLDTLAQCRFKEIKVCYGYYDPVTERRYMDKNNPVIPADAEVFSRLEPLYESLEGFGGDFGSCRRLEDLPETAESYVRFIENFLGIPITIIGVGQEQEQKIYREVK